MGAGEGAAVKVRPKSRALGGVEFFISIRPLALRTRPRPQGLKTVLAKVAEELGPITVLFYNPAGAKGRASLSEGSNTCFAGQDTSLVSSLRPARTP